MAKELPPRSAPVRPTAVVLDVIETLFSLAPLRSRFQAAGLPPDALPTWFGQFLRDAFALDLTGVYKPFNEVAESTLTGFLTAHRIEPDPRKIEDIMDGFAELSPHPDVPAGLAALRDAGIRLATLTNGSAAKTQALFMRAGLQDFIERTISIDEVGHWKPHREVYLHAAKTLGTNPRRLTLIAAHPWDIQGAARAGLSTGFIARVPFLSIMDTPAVSGNNLGEVARGLAALPRG